ncbi:MAG TPA: thymidylate kinase [Candidatus Nanoarchaeia archaeon]|nr:thymidylate kinase [Candidatus Nanoarchaeia archaeon]
MTFIVVDGLDGSGKSTQAQYIVESLKKSGKTVCLRTHPEQDNFFGIKAREFLFSSGKGAHFASAFFYMLDVIHSILLYTWRRNDYVIFVRYLMGTAYLPSPLHKIAYNFFATVVPKPELMLFLDVSPERAAYRITSTRDKKEMFEEADALRKVRAKALGLVCCGNWTVVDSNKPAADVAATIAKLIG